MLIDHVNVSDELLRRRFYCDLAACRGSCCIEGDAGAPLEMEEIGIIEDCFEKIRPFMLPEGIEVVKEHGVFDYDAAGNFVTPLVNCRECVFVVFRDGIAGCAIEKAFLAKKIKFRKPISCYLYPIRISSSAGFDTLHFHHWPICNPALAYGEKQKTAVWRFLKDPLIQKYGYAWYKKLEKLAAERKF